MSKPIAQLVGLVASVMAVTATTASAEQYLSNYNLPPQGAYASGSAHTYVNLTQTNSDHTACPAVAFGYGGYTAQPFTNGHTTAYYDSLCGPGQKWWYPNPSAAYAHGAVFNKNGATWDFVYQAWYTW